MPKVSIILITYNRLEYTKEAVSSVVAQSFKDWELVIVDDGSEDERLLKFLNDYARHDERLRVFPEAHLDIPQARDKALEQAQGKYIAVIDSDDIWVDENKLKKQVEYMDTHRDCVVVGGGVVVIDEAGKKKNKYLNPIADDDIRKVILYKNPLAHSSVLMRHNAIKEAGGYGKNLKVGEDYDLYLRLGKMGKLHNLPEYLLKYRRHSGNRSANEVLVALNNNIEIIKRYKNDYPGYFLAYLRRNLRLIVFKIFSIIELIASY